MKVLAIDTSSFPASASIVEDDVVLGEYVIRNKKKHSQNIMVMIERLYEDLGMNISETDVFAVTVGPGSFTGLRIGISTIRAFAQALNKPVVGVNTLEALAYNYHGSQNVIVSLLDARRDEVFVAAYTFKEGEPEEIMAPCVMKIDECVGIFKNAVYTGDGAIKHKQYLQDNGCTVAPCSLSEVRAASVGALALYRAGKRETRMYNDITPLYLRKSQAERELENKKSRK